MLEGPYPSPVLQPSRSLFGLPAFEGEEGEVSVTRAERAAHIEAQDRGAAFTAAWPVVRRLQWRLKQLANPSTSRLDRLMVWRSISDAALCAWEKEVTELDSLNTLKADPATEVEIPG